MSIQKNYFYNLVLTMSSYIVSLLVFPYVSRVLGVELLGKIDFVNNIVTYFSLFSLMGVSIVGIREISSCGNDFEARSRVFSSILSFVLLLTGLALVVYIVCVFFVGKLYDYRNLALLGSISLFFMSLSVEWLYQGIEQFKYISIRTIIVRIVYAIAIFLFVKNRDDYLIYYVLTILVTVVNAGINILYSRKYVQFKLKYCSPFKYCKEICSYGVYKLLTSMYTTFNIVYLGFVTCDTQVGFYTTSTKLFYILLGVFTAFTSVMLPRMSSIVANNDMDDFKHKVDISFELVFMLAIPIIIWSMVFTPQIITLLAGSGFEGAIIPMRMITPILFVTGIAQICVVQILMPLKKDNVVLIGSIVGAVIGISLNIILVKNHGAIGTAITLLCSEIAGDMIGFIYVIKEKIVIYPIKKMLCYIAQGIPYLIICLLVNRLNIGCFYSLAISGVLLFGCFIINNMFINKNSIALSMYNVIKRRIS